MAAPTASATGVEPFLVKIPDIASSSPATSVTVGPTAFFPPGTFSKRTEHHISGWYSKHLTAMHEPSLWAAAAQGQTVYRFLWLRTNEQPIAVRIVLIGGRAHLVAIRLTGKGGYDPGEIALQRERDVTDAEWQRVEAAIRASGFDTMQAKGPAGEDGAEWIIEAANAGRYRLVTRWSPEASGPDAAFRQACEAFLDLAGRDFVTGDVY